jgi:type IV pilus assembly protein PilA
MISGLDASHGISRFGELRASSNRELKFKLRPSLMKTTKRNGFSLIELLIVVAIILIIAAIAIPNLLRARISAHEASAVSSIHSVNTAEITYSSIYPLIGFSPDLVSLGPGGACDTPAAACIIDDVLASGFKSGYKFTYVPGAVGPPASTYAINADPIVRGVTGARGFYSDQQNVTHYNPTAAAGPGDPPLQ